MATILERSPLQKGFLDASRRANIDGDVARKVALRRSNIRLLIVDHDLRIRSGDAGAYELLAELGSPGALPLSATRELASWIVAGLPAGEVTLAPANGLAIRAVALEGENPTLGVFIERVAVRESLAAVVERYGLSARECDVVRQVAIGRSSAEIAHSLGISEYTVGDYLKRLFAKTGVGNRAELVARLLGWGTR